MIDVYKRLETILAVIWDEIDHAEIISDTEKLIAEVVNQEKLKLLEEVKRYSSFYGKSNMAIDGEYFITLENKLKSSLTEKEG